ncbi:MAG: hypothetical protein J5527_13040 [Treponema sp.]|nr:hypothetical protein [Treponema sp.]
MKKKSLITTILLILGGAAFMAGIVSCCSNAANSAEYSAGKGDVEWAGCRSSEYGIDPFPSASKWVSYVNKMSGYYEGSNGALIWIVGTIREDRKDKKKNYCRLNFPNPSTVSDTTNILFYEDEDENEAALTAFDKAGFSVWLQVEPGDADLVTLATIVMNKYKSHPCVKGFGVDVEWIKPAGTNGYGTRLSDSDAKKIDEAVKAVNPNYSVFVKHWDSRWLPKTYRSDMIFVNDSQMFGSLEEMQEDFQDWANHYAPNGVMFQIGYENDRDLWKPSFKLPARDLGAYLIDGLEKNGQKRGIIWVDFTLTEVL